MTSRATTLLVALVLAAAACALVLVLGREEPGRAAARAGPGEEGSAPAAASPLVPAEAAPAEAPERTAVAGPRVEPRAEGAAPEGREERAPEGPFLTGRVVDALGFQVPGARVEVGSLALSSTMFTLGGGAGADERTVTEPDGTFRVPRDDLAQGTVHVRVRARGFQVLTEERAPDVVSGASGDGDLGTFVLEPGVVLGGVVLDAEGRPVEDAGVRRTTSDEEGLLDGILELTVGAADGAEQVRTDAEGRFELVHGASGEYVLVVRHEAHPRGRFEGRTPPPGGERLDLVLTLPPAAAIAGRIAGFPAGREHVLVQAAPHDPENAVEAAPMTALFQAAGLGSGHSAKVAEDGSFLLEGLHAGAAYDVQAFQKDGIIGLTACSDARPALAGEERVELTWKAGASIVFLVRDATTNAEVRDVDVRFRWTQGTSLGAPNLPKKRSFDGGSVRIEELRPTPSPGTIELLVAARGYLEHREEAIQVRGDEEIDLGTVRLARAPVLRVRVVDAESGEPVKKARIALRPLDEDASFLPEVDEELEEGLDPFYFGSQATSGQSDGDGWCELPVPGAATATLSVRKSGYARHEETRGMPLAGTREALVRLHAGGRAEVLVVDGAGVPVGRADVHHRAPDGETDVKRANGEGLARFKDLAAGEHAFRAERPTGPEGSFRVRIDLDDEADDEGPEQTWTRLGIAGGEKGELTLVVPADVALAGRITSRGRPVPNAAVAVLEGATASSEEEALMLFSEQMAALIPGAPVRTRTDREGAYRLAGLTAGRHRLRVQPSDGAPSHVVPVELLEGENRLDVELPGTAIEGLVVDADGVPLRGATVRVVRADLDADARAELEEAASAAALFGGGAAGVAARDDGTFLVEGVPAGVPLVVEARAPGHVRGSSAAVTVEEGATERGVRVQLARAGSIRVRVLGEAGPFLVAVATYEGDAEPRPVEQFAVVRAGEARIADLAPGPWRVRLGGPGDDGREGQLVQVHAGAEADVALAP